MHTRQCSPSRCLWLKWREQLCTRLGLLARGLGSHWWVLAELSFVRTTCARILASCTALKGRLRILSDFQRPSPELLGMIWKWVWKITWPAATPLFTSILNESVSAQPQSLLAFLFLHWLCLSVTTRHKSVGKYVYTFHLIVMQLYHSFSTRRFSLFWTLSTGSSGSHKVG